jgi:hypothetical protein
MGQHGNAAKENTQAHAQPECCSHTNFQFQQCFACDPTVLAEHLHFSFPAGMMAEAACYALETVNRITPVCLLDRPPPEQLSGRTLRQRLCDVQIVNGKLIWEA